MLTEDSPEGMSSGVPGAVLGGIAVVAGAALLLEVLLTRIFAVTLWYHFGFLAISLALLGTAASAVVCYAYQERLIGPDHRQVLRRAALLLAAILPPSVALHLAIPLPGYEQTLEFVLLLGAQVILFCTVFFLAGLCISIALFRYARSINKVYSYDLLGAGAGSLLVVPLLYHVSGLDVVFFVSAAACVAASMFVLGIDRPAAVRSFMYAIVFLALGLVNPVLGILEIRNVKSYAADRVQQAEPRKVFEKWSPVSRVAVYAPVVRDGVERMMVTADAGAPTFLLRFDGDYEKLDHLERDSRQVVHALKPSGRVLIIGSAGGSDVLASLRAGHEEITAVEINPVTVELVSRYYADYIGRIFQDPRVTLHMHEGRNFVASSGRSYDVIQLTMIDSWAGAAAGAYIFNENSLYTREAVHDYWSHLAPDGFLSVTRYYEWDEALRLVNMIVDYLRSLGVPDVSQHIAVLAEESGQFSRATVVVKKGRFTERERRVFLEAAERTDARIIQAPRTQTQDMEQSGYAELFRSLISLADEEREKVVRSYPRDISPSTDDRPFFFFTDRLTSVFQVDPTEHAARRMALPLLYGMLALFSLIGALTIFGPLYLRRSAEMREVPFRVRSLAYFGLLGVGFMLIEVSLIQRLTVFLGHPTWSFVLVLTTLLWASGLGSLTSTRLPQEKRVLTTILGMIVVLITFYVVMIYDSFIDLMWLPRAARIALAAVVVALPGYLMGMCFPIGMRIVRRYHESLVPWGWAVNGAFSVLATILAVILALNAGLKASMLAGVVCYGIAAAVTLSLDDRRAPSTRSESA